MDNKFQFNNLVNITYYFGAGASANAIPMVSGINYGIEQLIAFIQYRTHDLKNNFEITIGEKQYSTKDLLEFYGFLNNWYEQVQVSPSIDTLAKRLFDNGYNKEYRNYKIFLTIVFYYFHFAKRIEENYNGKTFRLNVLDGRYENLFRSINSISTEYGFKTSIPDCFNFVSWNYDFQFEFSRIIDYPVNEPIEKKIEDFNKSISSSSRFIKLNGSSLLENIKNKEYLSKLTLKTDKELLHLLLIIYFELTDTTKDLTSLRFSWENKVEISSFQRLAQKTDILVIIGYSFPSFNRLIDKLFYSNLKTECIVYTQGRDLTDSIRIKNYFEQCFSPNNKPKNIYAVESPFFFVPPQYFGEDSYSSFY